MEPLAYGELGLKPWEFWRLTPREFDLCVAGFKRREDRMWHLAGWLGVLVTAPHTRKRFKVEDLVGRKLELMPKLPSVDSE